MPVTIPDEVLTAAHISEPELKQELGLTLFQQERLTLAQASRLAEMSQLDFPKLYNLEGGFRAWEKAGNPVEK